MMTTGVPLYGGFALTPAGELINAQDKKANIRAISNKCIHPSDVNKVVAFLRKLVDGDTKLDPQWENAKGATDEGIHIRIWKPGEGEEVINALDVALMVAAYGEQSAKDQIIPRLSGKGLL